MSKCRSALLTLALSLVASAAFAANVSTLAVASQTVTVTTSAAHGFAVSQGVCLTNTAACVVIATVPTATTFTFTQPSNVVVAACASTCGTAIAAPKIIVLDAQQPNQATQVIHYLMWLTTTTPIPSTGASSAWKVGAGSAGASAAQNNALAAGNFIEVNQSVSFPSSLLTSEIQVFLQKDYTTRQAALAANTQPGTYYGSVWDGSAWGVQ
jgi:hypothetical protein